MNSEPLLYAELSDKIFGAGMKVLNALKPGLNEKAYENALVIELRIHGHHAEQQRQFDVRYEGQVVDTLIPDLMVDSRIVVDPKVCESFTPTQLSQMIGYLTITDLRLALLLNYKTLLPGLEARHPVTDPCPRCNPWLKNPV